MKLVAPVTALTALVLVPIFLRLAFAVINKRRLHRVAVGSGDQADLETAIRAHGNFAEYVPFVLILMFLAEMNGAPTWLAAAVGVSLVAGRLVHARAIPAGDLPKRVLGMKLTFAALALGSIANLVPLLSALLA